MESPQDINGQINLLGKTEEALAGLYQIYAQRFQEHDEFWTGMAMEEIDHSNLIHDISQKIKHHQARLYEHLSGSQAMADFNNILQQETERAKYENLSHLDALKTSLKLVKYIVDHNYFYIFDSDSEEIRTILDELTEAAHSHYTFIKERLK
jgi:hypothetical protein